MSLTKSIRAIVSLSLLTAMMIGMTACNTVAGAGKDVQKAGEKTENAADAAKN